MQTAPFEVDVLKLNAELMKEELEKLNNMFNAAK